MANIMCKMCGGLLALPDGITFGECPCCGSQTTFPAIADAQAEQLYGDAERLRQSKDFDKAAAVYESLIARNDRDPEAYWGLFLSHCGIVYVEDPASRKRVPACVLPRKPGSILEDPDYRNALKYASEFNRSFYEKEGTRIAGILSGGAAAPVIVKAVKPLRVTPVPEPKPAPGFAAATSPLAADLPADVPKIVKRCEILMEQQNWNAAQEQCRRALDLEPENPDLYLMQCMINHQVSNEAELRNADCNLNVDRNFQVALKLYPPERRRQLEEMQQGSLVGFHLSKCMAAKGVSNLSQLSSCNTSLSDDENFRMALSCASPERQAELLRIQYDHADYCLNQIKTKYNVADVIQAPVPLGTDPFFQIALKDARPDLQQELHEIEMRQSDYFLGLCMTANNATDEFGLAYSEKPLSEDANFQLALKCASPERRAQLQSLPQGQVDSFICKCLSANNLSDESDLAHCSVPLNEERYFQQALKCASPERRERLKRLIEAQSDFFLQKCMKKNYISDASKLYKARKKLTLDPDFKAARKCASPEQARKLNMLVLRQGVLNLKRRVKKTLSLLVFFAILAAIGSSYFLFPEIGAVIGIPEKQFEVAEHYEDGVYFYDFLWARPVDEEKAAEWYRKAAEQGYPRAQAALGFCLLNGKGTYESESEADGWFKKAFSGLKENAKNGSAKDQYMLAQLYIAGRGLDDSDSYERWNHRSDAEKWLKKAAKKGYPKAQSEYGMIFCDGKDTAKWVRKAAEQGYPQAQYLLARFYARGEGVKEDEEKAIEWLRKAADRGWGDAQMALGEAYKEGYGELEEDEKMAFKWFLRAAKKGLPAAQYAVGKCYEDGDGVKENEEEALKWYRKAADKEYRLAERAVERLEND